MERKNIVVAFAGFLAGSISTYFYFKRREWKKEQEEMNKLFSGCDENDGCEGCDESAFSKVEKKVTFGISSTFKEDTGSVEIRLSPEDPNLINLDENHISVYQGNTRESVRLSSGHPHLITIDENKITVDDGTVKESGVEDEAEVGEAEEVDVRVGSSVEDEVSQEVDNVVAEIVKEESDPMKTSQEWYEDDGKVIIKDADGWKDTDDPKQFWHKIPISQEDYLIRRNLSTISINSLNRSDQKIPPFPEYMVSRGESDSSFNDINGGFTIGNSGDEVDSANPFN